MIGWVLAGGRQRGTYEENETGIVIPVTIVLLFEEG